MVKANKRSAAGETGNKRQGSSDGDISVNPEPAAANIKPQTFSHRHSATDIPLAAALTLVVGAGVETTAQEEKEEKEKEKRRRRRRRDGGEERWVKMDSP
ncbi:unnamed protein product [Pleuronectes platessa]|uniref:Uncharacterized protein n=1 Tax=Pleuronectes platessa TaxID=8262 RepID=A0A9N7TQU7_PLEPL|nr:unnamed protein product [Pleuronectes platessa]